MGSPLRSYLEGGTAGERALNFFSAFREVRLLAAAVTLTNLGGVAYGIVYYWDQFQDTPAYLLPFVPDSPVGPLLMIAVFGLWWFRGKRRSPALELLAFCFLLKFGIWTLCMFGLYAAYFFTPEQATLSWTLLVFHFGEALEAGVLLKGMRWPSWSAAGAALGWLLLGDFSDYVLGTHPRVPESAPEFLVVPFLTVALTFITFAAAHGWCRHHAGAARGPAGAAKADAEEPGRSRTS